MGNYIPIAHNIPSDQKYQMAKKYTKVFHFKAFKNKPNLGILVCRYTIWQPWLALGKLFLVKSLGWGKLGKHRCFLKVARLGAIFLFSFILSLFIKIRPIFCP
jgi:hypothetical protein